MEKDHILTGSIYLAEIDALEKVAKICSAYGWETHCENKKIVNNLSVLGTDFGKPNQTKIGDHLAKGNREMFQQMEEIVKKRIEALKNELQEFPKKKCF